MADALTNYAGNALLEHLLGRTTLVSPTDTYAGLFLIAPTESTSGTEASASGYARQILSWGAALDKQIANDADIRFPSVGNASVTWGTIVAIGIFDQLTSGNLLMFGPLSAPVTVDIGNAFKVVTGGLLATV